MKGRSAISVFCLFVASGACSGLESVGVRSRTGQFVVRGLPLTSPVRADGATNLVSYVRLDPTVFAIACETIKHALLAELKMEDQWRSMIGVMLHPNEVDNEVIQVSSIRYKNAWSYRVEIPERVDRRRVLKAMVEVLLLEIANRKAGSQPSELPPWLGEGLTSELQARALSTLGLESRTSVFRDEKQTDPLKNVREILRIHPPLTFNQLALPDDELLSEPKLELYSACSHLFLRELAGLKDGRRCLREMILALPEHLNWQTAFLGAFGGHFPKLIDADKWWTVTTAAYGHRETSILWGQSETWRQVEEILTTPVEVRLKRDELPLKTQMRLQSIISEWEYTRQFPVLSLKVNHLQALRLRAPAEIEPLLDAYRAVLESYIQRRGTNPTGKEKLNSKARKAIREAVRRLDDLDVKWETMKPGRRPAPPQLQSTAGLRQPVVAPIQP